MVASILDPVLFPLLALKPLYAILLVSIVLSVCITLIYKLTTDQTRMKRLRNELKKYQAQMKELRSEPEKMMKIQKKAMEKNMEYMKMSLKPTMFTFIPIILMFGWLGAHFGFESINPNEPFNVTVALSEEAQVELDAPSNLEVRDSLVKTGTSVNWTLSGPAGIYVLRFTTDGEKQEKKIIITDEPRYEEPVKEYKDSIIERIEVSNEKIRPFHGTPIENIPWIGNFGWLGTYIIFSLIFSISLRKALKLN